MSKEDMDPQEVLKRPEKIYPFAIVRPAGNDTTIVFGTIPNATVRKEVNDALMRIYPRIEQVGFVKGLTGVMAGGEFCGNFTRGAAEELLMGEPGELQLRISGVQNPLRAGVTENGEAFAQMPIYSDISKIRADGKNKIVEMEGITQFVNFDTDEIDGLSEAELKQKAMDIIREKNLDRYPAAGIIWSQKTDSGWKITPVVYVKAIDTLFAETACGSGTTALGLVLALDQNTAITDVPIVQPTGLPIKVSVEFDGSSFGYAQISGPVEKLAEGTLVQKENLFYAIEMVTDIDNLEKALTEGGLTVLYKNIFGKAPYFESFSNEEVKNIFAEYVRDGMLFLAKSDNGTIVGFGAALPFRSVPDIAGIVGIRPEDVAKTWYMADLGVKDEARNRGIGKDLVLARLDRLGGNNVVMRTSVDNIASQSLYRSLGFQPIPGVSQTVDRARVAEGLPTTDKRIFMSKQI